MLAKLVKNASSLPLETTKHAVAPGNAASIIGSELAPRLAVPPTWNKTNENLPWLAAAANSAALALSDDSSTPAAPKPFEDAPRVRNTTEPSATSLA